MRQVIEGVDFAVDEHIWGHRLYDEQLPHLAVLEFLGVLGSNADKPLREAPGQKVRYRPQRQIRLRGLLFNNPYVEAVRERAISDEDKWAMWRERFAVDADQLGDGDMSYLRDVFNSFDDFAKAIELLRSSSFEAKSNKRWSSKFVFPFGPDAMYEDLRIDADGGASNDRRFFARSGELLYLMLCRAKRGSELGDQLVKRLFDASAPGRRQLSWLPGDNYPGRWRRGDFLMVRVSWLVLSLVSFSTAVWQAKRRQAVGIGRGAVVQATDPARGCPQACPVGRWFVHGGRYWAQVVAVVVAAGRARFAGACAA